MSSPPEQKDQSLTARERAEMALEIFKELRRQDDLVHGWARTLIASQGAEAFALGLIWVHLANATLLRAGALLVVSFIGLVTCWVCVSVAVSDLRWQGKYVGYVRDLDPTGVMFPEYKPNSDNLGVQATWLLRMRTVLTLAWLVALISAVYLLVEAIGQAATCSSSA